MKQRGCWSSLFFLLVFLGIILYLLISSRQVHELPAPSASPPKPGYYTGGAVEFMVSANSEITDFYLADTTFLYCSISWSERGAFLVDNRYSLQGENSLDIVYAADGKFHAVYSIQRCGTRRLWFTRKGQYIAEWVGEKPSSP